MTIQAVKKNRCKLNMTAVLIRCHIQFRFCLLLKQTIRSIYSRSLTRSIENLQKKNYTIHPPPTKKKSKNHSWENEFQFNVCFGIQEVSSNNQSKQVFDLLSKQDLWLENLWPLPLFLTNSISTIYGQYYMAFVFHCLAITQRDSNHCPSGAFKPFNPCFAFKGFYNHQEKYYA